MGRYIGIDPGASGSLCLLDTDKNVIEFHDTPGNLVTARSVYEWILACSTNWATRVIGIEDVQAVPGTAATSNFKFGFNVGLVRGIAECTGIGVDLIRPQAWQKAIGIVRKKGRTKAQLKKAVAEIALRLYPDAQILGPKGGLLDGRADALMIAHAIRLKYEGGLGGTQ